MTREEALKIARTFSYGDLARANALANVFLRIADEQWSAALEMKGATRG